MNTQNDIVKEIKFETRANKNFNLELKTLLTGTLRKYVYFRPYNKKIFH